MAAFYYLTVNYKTAHCSVIPRAEVGPAEPSRPTFIPRCADFKAVCPRCMKEHLYSERDLMFHKRERYPNFPTLPGFLVAIHSAPHPEESLDQPRSPEKPQ
jgi:hypothetical protein